MCRYVWVSINTKKCSILTNIDVCAVQYVVYVTWGMLNVTTTQRVYLCIMICTFLT